MPEMKQACPVCETERTEVRLSGPHIHVTCTRCGVFALAPSILADLPAWFREASNRPSRMSYTIRRMQRQGQSKASASPCMMTTASVQDDPVQQSLPPSMRSQRPPRSGGPRNHLTEIGGALTGIVPDPPRARRCARGDPLRLEGPETTLTENGGAPNGIVPGPPSARRCARQRRSENGGAPNGIVPGPPSARRCTRQRRSVGLRPPQISPAVQQRDRYHSRASSSLLRPTLPNRQEECPALGR